jgi:hypothetical protein
VKLRIAHSVCSTNVTLLLSCHDLRAGLLLTSSLTSWWVVKCSDLYCITQRPLGGQIGLHNEGILGWYYSRYINKETNSSAREEEHRELYTERQKPFQRHRRIIGRICSMNGVKRRAYAHHGRKARRKEATRNTKTNVGG